jgi:type IV secretory pathway TrbL component
MARVLLLPCIALAFFFVKLGVGGKLLVVILGITIGLTGYQGFKKARLKFRLKRSNACS